MPILQALTIVKETAGNVIISNAVGSIHESVKEGETITAPLEASGVFPPMVISMVDVGEQTGALPEMLLKIADNYDEEVDNAVAAMTSLLEPIMIVFLAVIVGSIVIAMFMPLIDLMNRVGDAVAAARKTNNLLKPLTFPLPKRKGSSSFLALIGMRRLAKVVPSYDIKQLIHKCLKPRK